jgi:hypothetical protein
MARHGLDRGAGIEPESGFPPGSLPARDGAAGRTSPTAARLPTGPLTTEQLPIDP